jgi:hypothetical protein
MGIYWGLHFLTLPDAAAKNGMSAWGWHAEIICQVKSAAMRGYCVACLHWVSHNVCFSAGVKMWGIRRRCFVVNFAAAVGLLPGGCRLFDVDRTLSLLPLVGVLPLMCYRWCAQCAADSGCAAAHWCAAAHPPEDICWAYNRSTSAAAYHPFTKPMLWRKGGDFEFILIMSFC